MAKRSSAQFVCRACGASTSKWSGKCVTCGEWNTLEEYREPAANLAVKGRPLKTATLSGRQVAKEKRLSTSINDIDVVLGGGFVAGSTVLLAGQPGIGKSTLLMQVADAIAQTKKVLYVSAEESDTQLHMRAQRLGVKAKNVDIATSTSADDIAATINEQSYALVIVDSIQTVGLSEITSSAGSVTQITGCTQALSQAAKASGACLVLIGHVTKEGVIAGPKILEHLVDVVLNFEGERYGGFKLIRGIKNRFGATHETAILEMTETGLKAVENPSAALLEERQTGDGSVVLATMEGSRALLVEIQALVSPTPFGYPKRTAVGIELNRLNLLIAMLSRRTKLNLADKDVYVNVVGGLRVNEPAADLAICMAIASAAKGMSLKEDFVVFGEVGLSGEVRRVQSVAQRVKEARKLGFKGAIGPKNVSEKFVHGVSTVRDALNKYLSK